MVLSVFVLSCNEDNDDANFNHPQNVNATFSFTHNWDGAKVSNAEFNSIQFINANSDNLSMKNYAI